MGMVQPALDIYESLQMWQPLIECMLLLGRQTKVRCAFTAPLTQRLVRTKAEELVLARIKSAPEPKWWCFLGDIQQGVCCFPSRAVLAR